MDGVLNDTLCLVTGCLHPTPMDHLPILSGIQPTELCRLGATLFLICRVSLDSEHMLHGLLSLVSGSSHGRQKRLRFRRPFVSAARNLLNNLAEIGIRASQWTKYRWNMQYCECTSKLRVFIPIISARPVGLSWPKQLGLGSIVCGMVFGDSIRPCTNGVSLLHRIASAAPLNKPQTTS